MSTTTAASGVGTSTGTIGGRDSEQTREALRFLFGKEGEFLREFLLDEVSLPAGIVNVIQISSNAPCSFNQGDAIAQAEP